MTIRKVWCGYCVVKIAISMWGMPDSDAFSDGLSFKDYREVGTEGSERMKQRPIRVLVEALNRLGARIGYLENEGFPPLEIYGSRLVGEV